MLEWLINFFSETAIALTIWGLAVIFPFRRMETNKEIRWDLVAVAAVSVFAVAAANGLFLLFSVVVDWVDRWFELIEQWSTLSLVVAYVLFADFFRILGTSILTFEHAMALACVPSFAAPLVRAFWIARLFCSRRCAVCRA